MGEEVSPCSEVLVNRTVDSPKGGEPWDPAGTTPQTSADQVSGACHGSDQCTDGIRSTVSSRPVLEVPPSL